MTHRANHAALLLATLPALPAQTTWTRVPVFEARTKPASAYDAARGRVVLFGGWPTDATTWEWHGTAWTQRRPSVSPSARIEHAMAYDTARGRVVLFGGSDPLAGYLADTWEWDGSRWSQAMPAVSPPPSAGHGMAYDAVRGRTVLYGGRVPRGTTWEYDGTQWASVTTTQSPPRVSGHQLAYDAGRARVLFVGGDSFGIVETWEWNGARWNLLPIVGVNRPPSREYHSLAYDSARQRVVLFGGFAYRGGGSWEFFGDLWELDAMGWTQPAASPAAPSPRWGSAVSFDTARGRVVLAGGGDLYGPTSDTWEWNGATWQLRAGPEAPPAAGVGAMAFDAVRGRTVLHQGGHPIGLGIPEVPAVTWEFDGARWRHVATGAPGVRVLFSLAYDAARARTVLFGGVVYSKQSPTYLADTFAWDGSTWTAVPGASPPPRARAAMAFDHHRQRLLLHGGVGHAGLRSDTWELGASGWQQRIPAHNPPARERAAMVFDDARGRMVLFLADNTSNAAAETWEWDGTDWTQRQPVTTPPPRGDFGLAYDDQRARVVLFGGTHSASATAFQDTWEWNGTDWRQRTTPQSPAPRATLMAHDSQRGRSVIFGGMDLRTGFGDTWEYGPVEPASYQEFGAGCAGTAGVPRLRAVGLPWIGDRFTLRAERLPPGNSALVWLGASRSSWGSVALPLDLGAAGMPGCFLHVRPNVVLPLFNLTGVADASVTVPNDPALLGQTVYCQALSVDRAANAFGATTSNGGEARIGAR